MNNRAIWWMMTRAVEHPPLSNIGAEKLHCIGDNARILAISAAQSKDVGRKVALENGRGPGQSAQSRAKSRLAQFVPVRR